MIRMYVDKFADLLLGQFPGLEQAELDFAAAFPHGLIFRPDRKYQLPGEPPSADHYILLNFGVGSASIDRFLIDPGQALQVQATPLFQAMETLPGLSYSSLGQIRSELQEWVDFGDEIEVSGAASVTGSEKRNHDLSELRAESVRQWILDELGADPARVLPRWAGERPWPPRFDNDATPLFIQRRVEIRRLRVVWDMGEFDRILPLLEDTPQDRRIEQVIQHLQQSEDDVCVILDPLGTLRFLWMRARFDPNQSWIHDVAEWDSFGPSSPADMVTKLRWQVERRLHPGMADEDILREMRAIDDQLVHVRAWTHYMHVQAEAAASLLPDPTGDPTNTLLNKQPLYLDNMEKHLHDWFMLKELQPDSLYHTIYKPPIDAR